MVNKPSARRTGLNGVTVTEGAVGAFEPGESLRPALSDIALGTCVSGWSSDAGSGFVACDGQYTASRIVFEASLGDCVPACPARPIRSKDRGSSTATAKFPGLGLNQLRKTTELETKMVLIRKTWRCATLALASLAFATTAQADFVDDWLKLQYPGQVLPVTTTDAPLQLKFSHPANPTSLIGPWWERNAKLLGDLTDGKMQFTVYGGATLHGPLDGFKAVRGGVSDYAMCYSNMEPQRNLPMSKVFELPFLVSPNPQAANRVFIDLAPKYFTPEYEGRGVYFGNKHFMGYQDIYTKTPVHTLADLKGMKIAAQGTAPEIGEALGVVFVNMPFTEIFAALQQGIVDGTMWVDAGVVAWKAYEVVNYVTRLNLSALHLDQCFSQDMFGSLPPDLKRIFYNNQQQIPFIFTQRGYVDKVEENEQIYRDNGMEIIHLEPAAREEFKQALQPIIESWIETYEAEGLPARELIEDIKRLNAKYGDMTGEELLRLTVDNPVPGLVSGM